MRDCSHATTRAHTWQQRAVADSGCAEDDVLAIGQIVCRIDAVEIFFVALGDQLFSLLVVAWPHFALHVAAERFDPGSREHRFGGTADAHVKINVGVGQ